MTDGARIYVTEFRPGSITLVQVAASGGESSTISSPVKDPMVQDISPDRSQLLVRSVLPSGSGDTPLWALPLPTGSPRLLGDLGGHLGGFGSAKWSPDGRQILYGRGTDLYLANSDGTSSTFSFRRVALSSPCPSLPMELAFGSRFRIS